MSTNVEEKKDQQSKQEQSQDEKKADSVYNEQIVERVIVSSKPLPFYVDRARRALRLHQEITVIGFDNFISSACTVVETLKRQKIAHIKKIETNMDIPLLNSNNFVSFARPVPKIVIHLSRGELAQYLSGFYQRKVIEIFENADKESTGRLTYDQVAKLDFPNAFHATEEQKLHAQKEIQGKHQISLSDFIRFASHAIHPKLRDDVFKQIIEERYGIHFQSQRDNDNVDHIEHDDDQNVANASYDANNHNDQ